MMSEEDSLAARIADVRSHDDVASYTPDYNAVWWMACQLIHRDRAAAERALEELHAADESMGSSRWREVAKAALTQALRETS